MYQGTRSARRWATDDHTLVLLCLCGITIGGAVLRLWQIGDKGLWIDEAFSVWIGWQAIPDALAWLVRIDQHPPLYYLLLHMWMRLGDDAATVRALSALVSTLNIPVMYGLGQRLAGRKAGLLAAGILAISPFHVRFAQEARMYALLSLNASVAMMALAHLLTDPRALTAPVGRQIQRLIRSWRGKRVPDLRTAATDLAWAAYVLFTAATMLTHSTAILYMLATNAFVFGLAWARRRWPGAGDQLQSPSLANWLIAQLCVLALWSPWLRAFTAQAARVYREFWLPAPSWRTVVDAVGALTCAFLPDRIGWAWAIWAMYGGLVVLGAFHLRKRLAHLALLWVLFVTPVAGEWLVSLFRPIFYDRTLIWASIPLYLLLAAGIRQLRYRSYILVAVAMLATASGLSVREYFLYTEKEGWDDAAAYVAQRVEEGDLILFHATWTQIPFDFYYRAYDQQVEERGVPVDLFARGVLEPKMRAGDVPYLEDTIGGRERVWLVYSHQWYTDPEGLIPAALDGALDLRSRRRFHGLEVRLYGKPQAGR